MNKKLRTLTLLGSIVYILLLFLLTFVEGKSDSASIQGFADALWYSIVTLSTVGYGDLYPVTVAGRIIGVCFVLMSVGVLSFIIGAAISFLTGTLLPALRLRMVRDKQWYVFSGGDDAALSLQKDLEQHHPEALFLFPAAQADRVGSRSNIRFYTGTPEQAVADKTDRCSLFFMEADTDNYTPALRAVSTGFPVYARSRQEPEVPTPNLTLFNRYTCCAREYWRSRPLHTAETTILLVGSGEYAAALLEHGLLMNVYGNEHSVHWHCFGDWSGFRRNHPQLCGQNALFGDSLTFHEVPWNESALLNTADRILLCSDHDRENTEILRQLRRYHPIKGKLHLRAGSCLPGETVFGTDDRIYTEELVMGTQLTATAQLMHQIYLESTGCSSPAWEDLSPFLQQSNIAAADHLLTKVRMLLGDDGITALTKENCTAAAQVYERSRGQLAEQYREIEHLRWMRFHTLYNWQYAPTRDNAARLHPLMQPYTMLSTTEQAKDDYAWELIGEIAERM